MPKYELQIKVSWSEETHIPVTLETPTLTEVWPDIWCGSKGRQCLSSQSRSPQDDQVDYPCLALISWTHFECSLWSFPWFSLSFKAIARVHKTKLWHSPHSNTLPHQARWFHFFAYQQLLISSLRWQSGLNTQTANQSTPPCNKVQCCLSTSL
jgi:hypothetical protein